MDVLSSAGEKTRLAGGGGIGVGKHGGFSLDAGSYETHAIRVGFLDSGFDTQHSIRLIYVYTTLLIVCSSWPWGPSRGT